MTDRGCGEVREALSAFTRGELSHREASEVRTHLADCTECRAESDLAGLLLSSRPRVPEGLVNRIRATLRKDGARRTSASTRRPMWGLLAAAVAALTLGIGVSGKGTGTEAEWPAYAVETQGLGIEDDGMVAGAPSLVDLSDEALRELLEEWGA